MKKVLCLLTAAALLLTLCACGAEEAPSEAEYYWRAETESRYPLGLNGVIQGLAASDDCIFLCGESEDGPLLGRIPYEIREGRAVPGGMEAVELPELAEGSRMLDLDFGAGKFYVLIALPESYLVLTCLPDGSIEDNLSPVFVGDEEPKSILVTEDGGFCLRSLHNICLYDRTGKQTAAFSDYLSDLYPPLLIGGDVFAQSLPMGSGAVRLCRLNRETEKLEEIRRETEAEYLPRSLCRSALGTALINEGRELLSIGPDGQTETVLNWAELTGETGTEYRYVCQLNDNNFLMTPGDSGELILLNRDYRPDERKTLRIGFYGQASAMLSVLQNSYAHINGDYRVECIGYGSDEAGLSRLMLDVGAGDKLDIVVSDGWQVDPSGGFADLYPLIDADPELCREDFVPWMLNRLEDGGQLKQIWGGFILSTMEARGPLTEGPEPLRLADCQSYLDGIAYEGPLFGSIHTKENLLNNIAVNLLSAAYDEETGCYDLRTPEVMALLALCNTRPLDFTFDENGRIIQYEPALVSVTELQLGSPGDKKEEPAAPVRYFDGSDSGDNFSAVFCDYRACYMIPKTCADKESAWAFLRTMLKEDWQLKTFTERGIGFPCNAAALERALAACMQDERREEVSTILDTGVFHDYDMQQLSAILVEGMRPYFYGDSSLENAIDKTQSRLNLYYAERHG